MFIDDLQTLQLKIYYRRKGHHYEAYSVRDFEKIYGKKSSRTQKLYNQYQELNITMRELTWGGYNDLQEQAVNVLDDGSKEFSIKKYKEYKLEQLTISWDAKRKDSEGKLIDVPVNKSSLDALAPEIGEVILDAYEKEMEINEEDEKKSNGS